MKILEFIILAIGIGLAMGSGMSVFAIIAFVLAAVIEFAAHKSKK